MLLPIQSNEVPKDDLARIGRLLQNAFVIRRSHTTYFNWQTLYSLLLQAVEERDILLTKAVLDTFRLYSRSAPFVLGQFMEELKGMGAIPPGDFNMHTPTGSFPRTLRN